MKTSSFGVKVVGYMGDAGYMGDEYQARASLFHGVGRIISISVFPYSVLQQK